MRKGKNRGRRGRKVMMPAPVREIAVQTDNNSDQGQNETPSLPTSEMVLQQEMMPRNSKLPEVLMADDEAQCQVTDQAETNKLEILTSHLTSSEPSMQRVFPGFPHRKTAPRGRAHIIQRKTQREISEPVCQSINNAETHDSNIAKQTRCQDSYHNKDEKRNSQNSCEGNKQNAVMQENRKRIVKSKDNELIEKINSCDVDRIEENHRIIQAYKEIVNNQSLDKFSNKTEDDKISRKNYAQKDCDMKETEDNVDKTKENSAIVATYKEILSNGHYKSFLTSKTGSEVLQNCADKGKVQHIELNGIVSYKNWQHKNLLKKTSYSSPELNNENTNGTGKSDNLLMMSGILNNTQKGPVSIESVKSQIEPGHRSCCVTNVPKYHKGVFDFPKQYCAKVLDDPKQSHKCRSVVPIHNTGPDISNHSQESVSEESISIINNGSQNSDLNLELQEPEITLEGNIDVCAPQFLPILLKPRIIVEADIHADIGRLMVPSVDTTMDMTSDKDGKTTSGFESYAASIHPNHASDQERKKNKNSNISRLLGQLDISDVVIDSSYKGDGESEVIGCKRSKNRVKNLWEKEVSTHRPFRKCAPTVFYHENRRKPRKAADFVDPIDPTARKTCTNKSFENDHLESLQDKGVENASNACSSIISNQRVVVLPAFQNTGRIIGKRGMKRKRMESQKLRLSNENSEIQKSSCHKSFNEPLLDRTNPNKFSGDCECDYRVRNSEKLPNMLEICNEMKKMVRIQDKECDRKKILEPPTSEMFDDFWPSSYGKNSSKDMYWNDGSTINMDIGTQNEEEDLIDVVDIETDTDKEHDSVHDESNIITDTDNYNGSKIDLLDNNENIVEKDSHDTQGTSNSDEEIDVDSVVDATSENDQNNFNNGFTTITDKSLNEEESYDVEDRRDFEDVISAFMSKDKNEILSNDQVNLSVVERDDGRIASNPEEVTDYIAGRIKAKASKKIQVVDKVNRGISGWEESLRQKPKKTEFFQANPAPQKSRLKEENSKSVGHLTSNTDGPRRGRPRKLQTENSSVSVTNVITDQRRSNQAVDNDETGGQIHAEEDQIKPKRGRPAKSKEDNSVEPPDTVLIEHRESYDPSFGHVVWGQFGRQKWWPAIVVEGYMVLREQAEPKHSWLFWFGDHLISQLASEKIVPFIINYNRLTGGKQNSVLFKHALTEAVQVCAERCGCSNLNKQQMMDWAKGGFPKEDYGSDDEEITPNQAKAIPDFVMEEIDKLRHTMKKNMEMEEDEDEEVEEKYAYEDAIEVVKRKDKKIEDVCISCNDLRQEVVHPHPLFDGGLCKECKKEFMESFFAVGTDGISMFCAVCSSGGDMFVCGDPDCKTVFCLECVKVFLGEKHIKKIEEIDPWLCFLCQPYSPESHGYLVPKSDYRHNVLKIYDTSIYAEDQDLHYLLQGRRRKLRVLSLYDGIGTGRLVLEQLGIEIEMYYTSEIDQDSMFVTDSHFGESVTHLGDVTELTSKKLKEIGPIDLLVGSSPSKHLHLSAEEKEQLENGEIMCGNLLFLDFYRVLNKLMELSEDRHVFWMYGIVATLNKEDSDIISEIVGYEPALWDAKFFNDHSMPHWFWGNIPGMYSTPYLCESKSQGIDDCSAQKVDKPTAISNVLKPTVTEKDDTIGVPELERMFGLPEHYTDVGCLAPSKRRKLIRRSWSVPIISNIFSILREFYSTDDYDS